MSTPSTSSDGTVSGAGSSTTTCSENRPPRYTRSAVETGRFAYRAAYAGRWNGIVRRPRVVDNRTVRASQSIAKVWQLYRGGHRVERGHDTGSPWRRRVKA